MNPLIQRRTLVRSGAVGAAGLGLAGLFPAWAQTGSHGLATKGMSPLAGNDIRASGQGQLDYVVNG